MTREEAYKHAKEQVAKWPQWKQNIKCQPNKIRKDK